MPKRWYSYHEAAESSKMDAEIVADHKPYFMTYRYLVERRQYNAFIKRCKFDCIWKFGIPLEELLNKTDRTEDEENYVYWFRRNCPVSLGDCTMNRLCRIVEHELAKVKDTWKQKGKSFNYAVYRSSGASYTAVQFATISKIISNYDAEIKNVPSYAKAFKLDDAATAEYKASLTQLAKEELYCNCPSIDVLCNIILDGTCNSSGSSSLAWSLCGDIMIRNLLRRSGETITYYEKDDAGSIDYLGMRFSAKTYEIKEE